MASDGDSPVGGTGPGRERRSIGVTTICNAPTRARSKCELTLAMSRAGWPLAGRSDMWGQLGKVGKKRPNMHGWHV
jgi:hypothetical protein